MYRHIARMTVTAVVAWVLLSPCALAAPTTVNQSLSATSGPVDVWFALSSAPKSVSPALSNPQGYTWAQLTLIDLDEDGAASLTGQMSGFQYQAIYNGTETFALLIPDVSFSDQPPGHQTTLSVSVPWQTITATVTSIQSQWSFLLSAGDKVEAASEFTVWLIPAPGALVLGAIGAGLAGWLRRRRAL